LNLFGGATGERYFVEREDRMRRSVNRLDLRKANNEWAAIHRARSLVKCLEDEVLSKDSNLLSRLIDEIAHHCRLSGLIEPQSSL